MPPLASELDSSGLGLHGLPAVSPVIEACRGMFCIPLHTLYFYTGGAPKVNNRYFPNIPQNPSFAATLRWGGWLFTLCGVCSRFARFQYILHALRQAACLPDCKAGIRPATRGTDALRFEAKRLETCTAGSAVVQAFPSNVREVMPALAVQATGLNLLGAGNAVKERSLSVGGIATPEAGCQNSRLIWSHLARHHPTTPASSTCCRPREGAAE